MKDRVSIIVPSLNPDEKLIQVVDSLVAADFRDIIVVNDGSDKEHMWPFQKIAEYPQCTILHHNINRGKGKALKTAFSYVLEHRKKFLGVVTVDGDNQHQVKDIETCMNRMLEKRDHVILGCRDFSGDQVPSRSKIGNNITKFVFRYVCGLKISDTQTGLRAIPYQYLDDFIKVNGERFEYETNMLLELKEMRIPFDEVVIDTVYIEENASSHFNPLLDSLKIYRVIFKFLISSGVACVLDLAIFAIVGAVARHFYEQSLSILIATLTARVFSSLFNFTVNHKKVFHSKQALKKTIMKYYILCICQMTLSYLGVWGISSLLQIENQILIVIVKLMVDTVLFLISFQIQRGWVFRK